MFKWSKQKLPEVSNIVDITRCKNCNKPLKEARYKLHNEQGKFIGLRCHKCYNKYKKFVVAYLALRKSQSKLDAYLKAYDEQRLN